MPRVAAFARTPFALWLAFVLVHLWLGWINLVDTVSLPLGDVTLVYRFWMDQAFQHGVIVGVDTMWVYPVVALVPMAIAYLSGPDWYGSTWLTMVLLLNAVAFGVLTGWGRSRQRLAVGWWWVAFLLLLGPIALARIDAVTVPLAIIGMLVLATRPWLAGVLLTVAAWIKVWPAALVGAAVLALRDRLQVLAAALLTTAVVLVTALLIGSGGNVLSFISQQTGRQLQPESPVATIWMWLARAGVDGARVVYDRGILSYGVEGPGADVAAALMTPLQLAAALAVIGLALWRLRRGADAARLLPPLALAFVLVLIVFNKVGSPQFISWLAAPVILGLVTLGRAYRVPAVLALIIAALTQVVYPYLYIELLSLQPAMLVVLTVRNLLELVLLGWAVSAVARAGAVQPSAVEPARARLGA
ncbi:MAG TPA: glycosyltransferase 87 family protein [Rhodoglobus sp.]|nr:glycosyltransferase 87 family protein [Rhodoglobus sp.]